MTIAKDITQEEKDLAVEISDEKKPPAYALALGTYVVKGKVVDFSAWDFVTKLALVQKTPDAYIKTLKIDNTSIKYVDYTYAQKVLNFIFNFKISNRLIKEVYKTGTTAKGQPTIDCTVTMEYEFTHPQDGSIITRTVAAHHRLVLTRATREGMALSSAISKSWTAAAKTFGIGAGLDDKDLESYDYEEEEEKYVPPATRQAPAAKSFIPKASY